MKIVIRAIPVFEKLYLEGSPSSVFNGFPNSCFAKSDIMNKYKMVKKPRLAMAERDSRTVTTSFLSSFQD